MTTKPMTRFGARLRWWRTVRKLTQKKLAARTKLTQTQLSKYEIGTVEPSFKRLVTLCHALKITPDDLLWR